MDHSLTPPVPLGRLDDILERIGDAFFAVDAGWRCTHLNRGAARLLRERYGAVYEGLVGQVLHERLPAIAGSPLHSAMRGALEQLEPATVLEYDAAFRRWLESRIFPSDEGLSVLIRDVTDQHAARPPRVAGAEPGGSVPDACWQWDVAGDRVRISDRFYRLCGRAYEAQPLPLDRVLAWFHPEDRRLVGNTLRRALETSQSFSLVHRLVRPNGTLRTVRTHGRVVVDPAGRPTGLMAATEDLSDRIGADLMLRRLTGERASTTRRDPTDARLDEILASISDLFFSCDHEWRLTYTNRRADTYLRQIGKSPPAMLGRDIWAELPQLVGTRFHATALRAAAEGVEVEVEDWVRLPGIEQCFAARFAPSGEGMVCFARDVTLRKRAEAAAAESIRRLRESEDRFRLVVESVEDVVFRLDREQRCVDIFGRWLQREGYTPDMFIGRTTREIVGPAAAAIHEEANRRALAGESLVYEWELIRARGNRHLQTSLSPIRDDAGQVIGIVGVDRDMTQRFAAEREIQRLNSDLERRIAELQTLLDVIPIGIAIARDPECRTITVNAAFARQLGVEPGANISKTGPAAGDLPFKMLRNGVEVPPEELPMQKAARTGRPVPAVVDELVHPDGSRISLLACAAPLFDEAGRTRGAVAAALDITERTRREARERLLAEVGRLLTSDHEPEAALAAVARLAIPTLADFTCLDLLDESGGCRRIQLAHADPGLEAQIGEAARAHPPDPRWKRHPIARVLRTGRPLLLPRVTEADVARWARTEARARLGAVLAPRSLVIVPLAAHGRTIGAMTFGFSQSGRRHGREDLALAEDLAGRTALAVENARLVAAAAVEMRRRAEAESEASGWAFIFEHAAWGVAILSPDGGRIEAVNPAYARMHGYTAEELRGRPLADLFPPHRHAELPVQLRLAQANGHHIWESEHVDRAGNVFPVLIDLGSITDATGHVLCYAGTTQDLTERKRAEEQLRQAQKMDAIGRLAGGVAHDFNNMLMIIIGFADFLLGALDAEDPRRTDAAEIRKTAERAASLTRQLLSLGHPSIVKRQVSDLNAVIRDLDPMLRPLIPENVRIALALSDGLGGVAADRAQLEQVIMNLALNARDAMPNGGRLALETANVDLPEGYGYRHIGIDIPSGSYVMLVVSDTGEGIDAAVKERLFEPFFSTKPSSRNTGLGLATVYSIVSQTGGYIWVDSEPAEGAAFKILLPRVEPAAEHAGPDAAAPGSGPCGGSECVLIVEDEAAVRALAGRVLAGLGYLVLEAATGREALQVAREYQGPIDLVLTDVVMPEMGGLELVEELAACRPGLAVLVMSGYMEPERLRTMVRAAGVPFLSKPFSPASLGRKVRDVLDQRTVASGGT
jgi:PAS domain S-box-containing protein